MLWDGGDWYEKHCVGPGSVAMALCKAMDFGCVGGLPQVSIGALT